MNRCTVNIAEIHRIDVNLANNVFQIHAFNKAGKSSISRRFTKPKARSCFESLEPCTIGIEACGGTHQWGR